MNQAILVASAKRNSSLVYVENKVYSHNVLIDNSFDEFKDTLIEAIRVNYQINIGDLKKNIDSIFSHIYGKPLIFALNKVSELTIKIKTIMNQTGKSITEITSDIQSYFKKIMGYACSFYREANGQRIPVDSARILKAHALVQQGQSIAVIEDALYL